MAGFDTTKPRRRASQKAQLEAASQKRRHGGVGTKTVLAAAVRSSRRAKNPESMEIVQTTLQEVDVTTQSRLADWVNRENPVDVLRDEIDPQYVQQYAVQTYALRTDRSLERVTAAVAESDAGATANVLSRKAGAALRKEKGFSKTYKLHRGGPRQKIVRSGAQVQAKAKRDRKLRELPPELRPTYKRQRAAPGNNPGIKFQGAGSKRVVKRTHARGPPPKRSRAEISAQALTVRKLADGRFRFVMLKCTWSDKELKDLGFPIRNGKRLRFWDFNGPTAEADAKAFEATMMEWLENPDRVGPPPQPRKP
jgi:hypothetical protein